jgi:two-component system, NtrC family, response regulator GlrR
VRLTMALVQAHEGVRCIYDHLAAASDRDPVDRTAQRVQQVTRRVERERPRLLVLVADDLTVAEHVLPVVTAVGAMPDAPSVVVVARCTTAGDVVEVVSHGATEFIGLPLSVEEATGRLRNVLSRLTLSPRDGVDVDMSDAVPGFIGTSPALVAELRKIPLVAACDASVLITGETGTGKELCAQAIHTLSARKARPFVPINCGAIPHDLVENELFGHERGAFTGASTGRRGLVHEADGGTLFLDEIDSLPLSAQVKMLRLLQDGSYRPLGSTELQRARLRFVAATNGHLSAAVAAGRFRQDLYFRLNVIPIHLPPLRERRDDIPRLARFFVLRHAQRLNRPTRGLTTDALAKLSSHSWPGNVRELEHVIERAVVLSATRDLRAGDIALAAHGQPDETSFHEAKARVVSEFEQGYLRTMLSVHHGNISRAAAAAGKDRRAFFELLRKHAIDPGEFRRVAVVAERRLAS